MQTYIQTHHPQVPVRCAWPELTTPDLSQAVQELVDAGSEAITIVPCSWVPGKHAREDLPVLLEDLRTPPRFASPPRRPSAKTRASPPSWPPSPAANRFLLLDKCSIMMRLFSRILI